MQRDLAFKFNYDADEPMLGQPCWRCPTELPNLEGAVIIALDTETYDPHLMERGPGWDIGDGHIIGVSVAVDRNNAWYIPVLNKYNTATGFTIEQVIDWVTSSFTDNTVMVGANLTYDVGWLTHHGAKLDCSLFDVQFAAALLDEHAESYSLDALAYNYGLGGKLSTELYEWCSRQFGGPPDGSQRKHMHEAPLRLVGPYAEADAYLPLEIMERQYAALEEEDLFTVADLEHDLIPMMIAMRRRGIRVNMKARDELSDYIAERLTVSRKLVREVAGREVNVNAAADIAKVFDAKGWEYPLLEPTEREQAKAKATGVPTKPKPSFKKDWMLAQDNPFAKAVADLKRLDKLRGTFVDGYFSLAHEGRVHSQIHQLRSARGGTVSGRVACSKVNIQNIPSRDPEFGPLIRGLFIPEEGETWASSDYSQIEYRFLAHYARGQGADAVRAKYNSDPSTDFHQHICDQTGMARKPAKCLSFGLCYGSGAAKVAEQMGCSLEHAREFRQQYFDEAPFVKTTFDACVSTVSSRGFLFTIMGRRARFPFWEPDAFKFPDEYRDDLKESPLFRTREESDDWVADYFGKQGITNLRGTLSQRAKTYKALNSLLQGSAADLMKKAMLDIWKSGVCDVLGAPLCTVHDELNWSMPETPEGREAVRYAAHIMETSLELKVPARVVTDYGKDWGHLE